MRPLSLCLLVLLVGCGGGSSPSAPATPPPVLLAVSGPLDGLSPGSFEITGSDFPGGAGDRYVVRFTSAGGPLFGGCDEVITGTVEWISSEQLRGVTPSTRVYREGTAYVAVAFSEQETTSATPLAVFLGTPDPAVDQDGNGVHDACDPNTYNFEGDDVGSRPSGVTQLGAVTPLSVVEVNGDRVARYVAGSSGSGDRFDRLQADYPQQNTTVYVDWESAAGVGSIELWSEGSFSDFAGAGFIVQVRGGLIYFFERLWRGVPSVVGPAVPADGRMRIRVRKGPGTTSAVHIDTWDGSTWAEDYAVFPVADDTNYRGLATTLAAYSASAVGIKRITVVHEIPSAPLTLANRPGGLASWKLFPRDDSDEAVVPVEALVRLMEPGHLEACIVRSDNGQALPGHDWADHRQAVPAGDGQRVRMDLTGVPTGGNYDVHVRLLSGSGAVLAQEGVQDIAVGDIYICAGQSNMSGYSGNLLGATTPIPEVHRFHNDGRWTQGQEPIDDGAGQLDAISRETPLHSLALPFARRLYEMTGVPVALVPTSLGGTNLYVQWQRDGAVPAWRATLYGSMIHRARMATGGAAPAGLLWFQGESDALGARTTAQYKTDLDRFFVEARTDLAAPDMLGVVAQLGTFSSANLDLWLPVQEAQRQVARDDSLTALVTTVDAPRSDAIHFNVVGYQTIGERFANAVHALKFGSSGDPLTELVSVGPGSDATRIDLTYDANITGGAPTLFSVTDDTGTATVTSVTISGAVVTLVLDRALGTNAVLDYGRAVDPTAAWLLDVNGVPVPCFHGLAIN